MDAIKTGIELHKELEKIFNSTVDMKTYKVTPALANESDFRRAMENYHAAVEDLDRILNGEAPKLRTVFEETLRNDGVYEYTSTGTCDGSQSYFFRRKPAIASNATGWEPIDSIPEGAKYNHD